MGSLSLSRVGLTMVCAPVMGESVDQVVEEMHKAKAQGADVVEVRLDCIKQFQAHQDLEIILKSKPLPVIIVYRPKCEGGLYEGDETARLEALRSALKLGADYVDFELKVAAELMSKQNKLHCGGTKVIVSCFLDGVIPSKEELSNLATHMKASGADIIKIVTSASNITELARLFHLLSYSQMPVVAYAVGERGLISQLLSPKFGSTLVYGSIEGMAVPGLPTLESLRKVYKVEHINSDTTVFGLISKPVGHSKGPILHNPTFRRMNINGLYVPMFVDNLKEFFEVYSTPDFAGFSVGFPYKEAVIQFCDEVHPLAQTIGAVNTIVRRPSDGKLIGYNTDCEASVTAMEDALQECQCINGEKSLVSPLAGKEFVLVGAGGAGRALAFGAKTRGARIIIFDIDFERAKMLAHAVSGEARPFGDLPYFQPEKGSILANATPIGMHPNKDRIPVSEASLGVFQLIFDAVYTPRKTTLLKEAEAAGAITVSGVEMFLRQAIGQFNLFTGGEAPKEFMREIVLAKF